MGVRRPAFALILVLLLVASIFAMTIHSAIVLRSSIVETGAVGSRQRDLRIAQSAASLVLRGMSSAPPAAAQGGDGAGDGTGDGSGPAPEERLDLPPIVRQMLAAAGEQIEEEAEKEMDRGSGRTIDGAGTGDVAPPPRGFDVIRGLGLPVRGIEVVLEDRRCVVEVRDAMGVLNINRVEEPVLREYLALKGFRGPAIDRISDQILDWRDEDSMTRAQGLEREGYRLLGIVPRNAGFRSLDELRMLPAIDERILASIRGDLCLDGDGTVHLGSASPEVLRAAGGLTEGQVRQLINLRAQGPLTPERVQRIVDLRGEAGKRVRLEPSPVVGVRVLVHGDGDSAMVFEGAAVFSGEGVASLGLRPAD